jgi:hypothetical protein
MTVTNDNLQSILNIEKKDFKKVVGGLFAYLFRRIDLKYFITYIGDREEANRIKDIARNNGYILKNCKLYAYAWHVYKTQGGTKPSFKAYKVDENDASYLRKLILKHVPDRFRAFTLVEFDKTMEHMLSSTEIKNNIGKFISKKMMFLIKSYGISRHDIEMLLQDAAILAVYKMYPLYETYTHFESIAKASIHNAGHTFITSSTTQSRQRLERNADGTFENLLVQTEVLVDLEAPPEYSAHIKDSVQSLVQLQPKMSDKVQEFLLSCAGHYNEGLTAFLKKPNDELAHVMDYQKYLEKVRKYYKITEEQQQKLFKKIRPHI